MVHMRSGPRLRPAALHCWLPNPPAPLLPPTMLPEYLVNVRCYTFGAPRVGNRAWARQYNQAVPDTWHIINSDDVVTSAGKVGPGCGALVTG